MKNIRILAVGNFISFLIHVTLSYLTQFKLVNERDVGEISKQYSSLFTPAPVTFAIWGVIYISLAAFCIYHLIMAFRQREQHPANLAIRNMGGWFVLNNLVTAGWLLAWTHDQILMSLVLIAIQLISLIAIHLLLGIYDTRQTIASKVFTQAPLSIYFGWITIAGIANTCAYLVSSNWNGFNWNFSEIRWMIIVVSLAIFISLMMIVIRKNVWYGLVVIWALYGIIIAREADGAGEYGDVINFCWVGMGLLAIACLFQFIRNALQKPSHSVYPLANQPIK